MAARRGTAVYMAVLETKTARVSYVTYLKEPIPSTCGVGLQNECLKGESSVAMYQCFANKVFFVMAEKFSVFSCKVAKGEMVSLNVQTRFRIFEIQTSGENIGLQKTFRASFIHLLRGHRESEPLCCSTSQFIFLVFYLLAVSKQICSVLNNVSHC